MNLNPFASSSTRSSSPTAAAASVCLVAAAVFAAMLCIAEGPLEAGPFKRRLRCQETTQAPCNQATCPIAIGQLPASREEMQAVQQPWYINGETENLSSQQPDTVLEPVPGTGSRLGIGGKVPDKITHTLDPATIAALKEALKNALPTTPSVPISLPMEPATTERLSRISLALEILAWLGAATFGSSTIGKALPLVARVASGLLSASAAASQAAMQTAAAPSSTAVNTSLAANPAAGSSTPKPGT